MQTLYEKDLLKKYLDWTGPYIERRAKTHIQFLAMRQQGLQQMVTWAAGIENSARNKPHALFSLVDLQEFASGDVVKCLGQSYAVYDGRRSPRIPNGDLLLMSRVTAVEGKPGHFEGKSTITSEYDVPEDAWYLSGLENANLPVSICLEIALQPCGFLSAYLGTPLRFPEVDYLFRNLDGQVQFVNHLNVRGKTIQTHAELTDTIFSGRTIIQHFSFEVTVGGQVLLVGSSSFGYFPSETMVNQVGLDGGKTSPPWFVNALPDTSRLPISAEASKALPAGKLKLIEQVIVQPDGGVHGGGYAYASRTNSPDDWFYSCHFYQDPVMPGSLGIEAIIQAMKVYGISSKKHLPTVHIATGKEITWKYRGQVLQSNREMQLEVHFHKNTSTGRKRLLSGDASLWADGLRIYEVKNLTMEIQD